MLSPCWDLRTDTRFSGHFVKALALGADSIAICNCGSSSEHYLPASYSKHNEREVHMRASWIFSKNDVIADSGIIISSGFVYLLEPCYQVLIVGMIISILVIRGGIHIIKDASNEKQIQSENCI